MNIDIRTPSGYAVAAALRGPDHSSDPRLRTEAAAAKHLGARVVRYFAGVPAYLTSPPDRALWSMSPRARAFMLGAGRHYTQHVLAALAALDEEEAKSYREALLGWLNCPDLAPAPGPTPPQDPPAATLLDLSAGRDYAIATALRGPDHIDDPGARDAERVGACVVRHFAGAPGGCPPVAAFANNAARRYMRDRGRHYTNHLLQGLSGLGWPARKYRIAVENWLSLRISYESFVRLAGPA